MSEQSKPEVRLPLEGVRVLDMSEEKSGMCGRYLADLGATVIRLDAISAGPSDPPAEALLHARVHAVTHHAGKHRLSLDPADVAARDRLEALLDGADIWIRSRADAWRIDPADAAARHPELVIATISDFGTTGPYASWTATDGVLDAMTGALSQSGLPGREPLIPPADIAIESAAVQAVFGVLAAYLQRLRTGRGDELDLSLFELAAQSFDPSFGTVGTAHPSSSGDAPTRDRPSENRYPIFPCADGFVRLAILAPRQWRAMRAWLGEPDDLQDPALDSIFGRAARLADLLGPHYARLFGATSMAELSREGQSRGIPIAPVNEPSQVLSCEQFNARGAFCSIELEDGNVAHIPAGAMEFDGRRAGPPAGGPARQTDSTVGWPEPRPPAAFSALDAERPLTGVRVIDLGVIVVGADTARLLADQGADVIKVESEAYPDMTRIDAFSFVVGHRSSRSVGLNLRSPEGIELFRRLVAGSDVVLSNFKPGTLDKLGLSAAELRAINPEIIVLSSSAFGATGPWSGWMGYGPLVRSTTGVTALWRYPDAPEAVCDGVTIYPDHFAGRVGAIGVLAALIGRARHGDGGVDIRVSQAEASLMHLSTTLGLESVAPGSQRSVGNAVPGHAPAGVFPCAGDDEWAVIDVPDDATWSRLVSALEQPEWASDPDLCRTAIRLERRAEIEGHLAAWTRTRAPREVAQILQGAGIPAGPMLRAADLREDPHLIARRFFAVLDQPGMGGIRVENATFTSAGLPDPDIRPAPLRGEHTREVARELLDLNDQDIEKLLHTGALEDRAEKITI